ncbi:MAG: exodeoxyribonuclease VII small subunit [Clostridia bacterium]|nr:exodeoxyribonuclease VII small subunit [Clostridia bacterium]
MAEMPFEEALERLETVVRRLESGELTLEDSLRAFEEGVLLVRHCQRQLDAAERRLRQLLPADAAGGVREEPFTCEIEEGA